jgi:hypothetical protein
MPPNGKKRVRDASATKTPNKRPKPNFPRGTASQPEVVDTQVSPPPPTRPSPRKATVQSSQASTFESTMRETQREASIVPPTEGSQKATTVPSTVANEAVDEVLDEDNIDTFDGIVSPRIEKYCKPETSQRSKKSWIYRYG